MTDWYENQKKPTGNFSKLLKERIETANLCMTLTAEEAKRFTKLEVIAKDRVVDELHIS